MTETRPGPAVRAAAETAENSADGREDAAGSRLISATAVMATGTMASRILGFARIALLAVALGNGSPQVDTFNIANGIPNMLYILLAGGVLNTVFVPQIVRAMKNDPDGGEAYTNRLVTVGLLGLGLITIATTLLAPAIMWLYTDGRWKLPQNEAHFHNIVLLAYLCLPQIFFYGVNVLIGQVLNSRGKFGPMAWSPLANNVIAVAVLAVYLAFWRHTASTDVPFTTPQLLLLGLGSTLGIVVQAAVLIPFMARSGFRYRPRFDLRGAGLGRTAHLAKWTLGYVLVTQVAVWVSTRLASGATLGGPGRPAGDGAGLTVYNNAYLLWILPHSLITVSLATALLPSASRRAASGDLDGAGHEAMRAMRLATTAIVPATVAFFALAFPLSQLLFGNGRGARDWPSIALTLTAFAIGLIPFTIQYLCLRGFYALEDTRTPFFIQLVIAGVNCGLALLFVLPIGRPQWIAVGLALAYALAYVCGLGVSFRLLKRRLPALSGTVLVRHCVRLGVAVVPAGLVAAGVCQLAGSWSESFLARALALVVGGLLAVLAFLALSRLLHIPEVEQIMATVGGRFLPGRFPRGSIAETAGGNVADPAISGDSSRPGAIPSGTIDPDDAAQPEPGSMTIPMLDPLASSVPAIDGLADAESSIVTHVGASGAGQGMASTSSGTQLSELPTAVPTAPGQEFDHPSDGHSEDHLPPGTILGARYRLEELLVSAQPAVTWRAFDQVLSRSVLVHLLPVGDPRAPRLLEAARRAAIATDSRFLRVLDAVDQTPDQILGQTTGQRATVDVGSYIVCEYTTGQSLQTILTTAPLTGLEAGWVLREIADAIGAVHALGLHHRRINPDTVIITPTGNIKIVGLLIESVLRPDPVGADSHAGPHQLRRTDPDTEAADVYDLGRLLYAMLVARWPGGSAFGLPAAPHGRELHLGHDPAAEEEADSRPQLGPDQQRWLSPRQVRHGVSPALDRICDQLLSSHPRHRVPPIGSATQLVAELGRVLGPADASSDLERRLRHPGGAPGPVGDPGIPRSAFLSQSTQNVSARSPRSPGRARAAAGAPAALSQPVPASRAGQAVRPGQTGPTPAVSPSAPAWSAERPDAEQSRRHPRRWIALLIALALVAVLAVAVSAVLRNPTTRSSNAPTDAPTADQNASPAPSSSAAATSQPVTIAGIRDFDPTAQGGNGSENPRQVGRADDGNPKTRWTTLTYFHYPKLGRLKKGVGLVLDLGRPVDVGAVHLRLSGSDTDVQLRVPTGSGTAPVMTTDKAWRTVASVSGAGSSATLEPPAPVQSQYLLVYLTSLPKEGSGYRGGIYEVEVTQ